MAPPPDIAVPEASRSRISRRVSAVAPSATLAIDAKAKALKAEGVDVVGFGAGEPDFPTPDAVVEAAVAACRDSRNHRYTPTAGLPELRAAVAAKTERDSRYSVAPSQVLVTNGGKQAIANAFATLLDPGDEVLVPAPYWTTYPEAIALAGGVPVGIPTDASTGFQVGVEQLESAATDRTKAIVFVSPSNPSGAVYGREAIAAIGELALSRGWWVLTDEIYEHFVYGEAEQSSMPVLVPDLADRCVVVNGVAKTYAMTGWRVGWMIAPRDVVDAATNLQSHETSNVSNVAQRAALAAVSGDLEAAMRMRDAFDRRRRTIHAMLNDIPGVTCFEPQGAFYAFPSFEAILGREIRGRRPTSTLELAEVVLDEAQVAFVPGEAFGAPGYARFSYALSDDDLVKGISRIGELLREVVPSV
ncbi:MAG: pyridoxal phosphate-dependent aminotransferase [Actinomycetota bacterium]|nr:pyridoxal phosphate-dependent aminotransferase [Actinomycetota bacterium]